MIDLSNCKSLNDISRLYYGKANYSNREKCKKILESEGIDWREWLLEKKKKGIKYCLFCGNEIQKIYDKKQKFCSCSCAAKYNNSNRIISENTRRKISESLQKRNKNFNGIYKPLSERTLQNIEKDANNEKYECVICGKELINKRSIYCSNHCHQVDIHNKYIQRWQNGEENGMKGEYGISNFIKKYLYQKYNNKCQLCGWGDENKFTHTIPLEIHHIDGDYTNNKEENLQLLCPNCHSLTETHKSHNKQGRKGREKYYIKNKR